MRRRGPDLGLLGAWLGTAACLVPSGTPSAIVDPDTLPAPEILGTVLACDRDAGRWRLVVETSAWAAGGALIWTADGDYTEQHDGLRSVRAAPDGLGDRLVVDVSIVDDVRGAADGRTVLRCPADVVYAVQITDFAGTITDCVVSADDPRLQASGARPAGCDRVVDGGDTDA